MTCKYCGNECLGDFCYVCGNLTPEGEKAAKATKKKPILFKWWFWIIVVAFLATGTFSVIEQTRRINHGESVYGVVNNTQRKSSGTWLSYQQPYIFAVDVSSFVGDVYSPGVYNFSLQEGIKKDEYMPAFYDIYICDALYDDIEEMQEKNTPTITVGGLGSEYVNSIHQLKSGQYVYVVPYVQENFKPTGYLSFEKLEEK